MFSHNMSGGVNNSWQTWDQFNEVPWDSDTFLCVFTAPGDGDDETGVGMGLTGADLVLTFQAGHDGYDGEGRYLDGNYRIEMTEGHIGQYLYTGTSWMWIIHAHDMEDFNNAYAYQVYGDNASAQHEGLYVWRGVSGTDDKLHLSIYINGAVTHSTTTDDVPNTMTDVWFVCEWDSGTNVCKAAWTTSRPFSWGDIPADQTTSQTKTCTWASGDLADWGRGIGNDYNAGNQWQGKYVYYIARRNGHFF